MNTLPAEEGLRVTIRVPEGDGSILEGRTNESGMWSEVHGLCPDTAVALVIERDGVEVVRCNTMLSRLTNMDCLMRNPEKLNEAQVHKRFMAAHREQKKRGVENPDPESVARQAFTC